MSSNYGFAEIHQLFLIRTFLGIAEPVENSKHARKQSTSGGGGVQVSLKMGMATPGKKLAPPASRMVDELYSKLRGLEIIEKHLLDEVSSGASDAQSELDRCIEQKQQLSTQLLAAQQAEEKALTARVQAEAQAVVQHMLNLVPSANPLALDLIAKACLSRRAT